MDFYYGNKVYTSICDIFSILNGNLWLFFHLQNIILIINEKFNSYFSYKIKNSGIYPSLFFT